MATVPVHTLFTPSPRNVHTAFPTLLPWSSLRLRSLRLATAPVQTLFAPSPHHVHTPFPTLLPGSSPGLRSARLEMAGSGRQKASLTCRRHNTVLVVEGLLQERLHFRVMGGGCYGRYRTRSLIPRLRSSGLRQVQPVGSLAQPIAGRAAQLPRQDRAGVYYYITLLLHYSTFLLLVARKPCTYLPVHTSILTYPYFTTLSTHPCSHPCPPPPLSRTTARRRSTASSGSWSGPTKKRCSVVKCSVVVQNCSGAVMQQCSRNTR